MRGRHVLIIVQNLPVPLDRRVWLECQALIARGYAVSVICPKGPGDPARQLIDGVHIYQYRPAPEAKGGIGFAWEFGYSWVRSALLSLSVFKRERFDTIQACNPPDTYWLLARCWRLMGVSFVFDQHDLNPELFLSRFGMPTDLRGRLQLGLLRWLERATYRTADRVLSTNESYRRIALTRGRRVPEQVTVVRSGPDTDRMRPLYPPAGIRVDGAFLLVYLGIMGPQDGVDIVLDVMHELVHKRGRTDVRAALLGFGDCLEDLQLRSAQLRLQHVVTFTGRADRTDIANYLSAADIGICPDLKTPLNDVSTMNKTMEYMAYALPSVAFDLVETQISGGDAVLYVRSGDVPAMCDEIERLLDDSDLRLKLGRAARDRVATELDWKPQALRYVAVFDELTGGPPLSDSGGAFSSQTAGALSTDSTVVGPEWVDLDDLAEFERFIVERSAPAASLAAGAELGRHR